MQEEQLKDCFRPKINRNWGNSTQRLLAERSHQFDVNLISEKKEKNFKHLATPFCAKSMPRSSDGSTLSAENVAPPARSKAVAAKRTSSKAARPQNCGSKSRVVVSRPAPVPRTARTTPKASEMLAAISLKKKREESARGRKKEEPKHFVAMYKAERIVSKMFNAALHCEQAGDL